MELTPLQLLAYKKIQDYEKELEKRGLRVRLSIEQEFLLLSGMQNYDHTNRIDMVRSGVLDHGLALNERGKLSDFKNVLAVLTPKFPALHEMEREFAAESTDGKSKLPIYEAKFDSTNSCKFRPSEIAMQVHRFRHEAPRHLALNPGVMDVWFDFKGHTLEMVADSLPMQNHPQLKKLASHFDGNQPMGMHIGASVYDRDGKCLSDNYGFYRAQSERLLNLQYKGGLGFIQNAQGLKRLGINIATPRVIGLGSGGMESKHKGYTLLERERPQKPPTLTVELLPQSRTGLRRRLDRIVHNATEGEISPGEALNAMFHATTHAFSGDTRVTNSVHYPDRYLENRMMGADADPFVATAMELASIVDMVRNTPQLQGQSQIGRQHVDRIWNYHMGDIDHSLDHPIEQDMQSWVDRFNHHRELRTLLGDELYDGILKEYGSSPGR